MPIPTDPPSDGDDGDDGDDGRVSAAARLEIAVLRSKNVVLEAQVRALREQLTTLDHAHASQRAETSAALRTPLGSIVGYTEILLEEAEERGLAALIPDLEHIRAACDDLLGRLERASLLPEAAATVPPAALIDTVPTTARSS